MEIDAVHCETIIANQIRNKNDVLLPVEWDEANVEYDILTLNQALRQNPSILVTLSYERLSETLYNPLTFRQNRNKPSFIDLFFQVAPQEYIKEVNKLNNI